MNICDATPAQFLEEVGTWHLRDCGSGALGDKASGKPINRQKQSNLLGEFERRSEDARAEVVGKLQSNGPHGGNVPESKLAADGSICRRSQNSPVDRIFAFEISDFPGDA